MDTNNGRIIPVPIEDEIKESYLNYAMSVIVSRALPDVRDGLKPVHRRILYAMNEMGLRSDKTFKKCGRIVGDVLGKYHPHGDQSIYDALVRLAQDFSMRYPVIKPQGNFGSVDGDPPAAMRYTESKMAKIADELLRDIKKDTVDFTANYDDSMKEPSVLPGAVPFLLINGGSGIAVGMATNIPPHNLSEIVNAIEAYIDNSDITISELMEHVKGPDFPTAGIIYGRKGIRDAFETGRGKIAVRARVKLETTKTGRDVIIVTELPYQVNKANLIIRMADLVKNKKVDGISDLRDESDRNGMRIVIELKRGAIARVILNRLFSHTSMQQNFNVNNLALVNGKPELLNLKQMIHYFVLHRIDVVTRRTKFDLARAKERAHILEGIKIALDNIDEVIKIIKESKDVVTARENLMKRFGFSEKQTQAILDMRLQKLTSLETQKILEELKEIIALIEYLEDLLSDKKKILAVIKGEILELKVKYGDDRRTEIIPDEVEQLNIEDLIEKEDMAVLISNKGFIKRIAVSAYKNQGRGGKGASSAKLKNEDFLEHVFIASTHDYILFVTSAGKAYWIKVHEIPEASRAARGTQIKALLDISADEEVSSVVSLGGFTEDQYIFMATSRGVVKRVKTHDFRNARTKGIIAIKLDEGDRLVASVLTSGDEEVFIITRFGSALRFHESLVRSMGRATRGVRGIKLKNNDELAGILRIIEDNKILVITENGYGKRVEYNKFSPHGRGTGGQNVYKTDERTGEIIGVQSVNENDDLVCITSKGNTIKLNVAQISIQGKNTQGIVVVNLNKPNIVVSVARVINDKEDVETP
ncbi:MAG: DNA topoisomerase (ATP-hydrolyzing) subunit A [Spirochaetales bacterium]|nr:DNA topoisomerase (ATP-hydrolyzing) subunit A [Spirochaetales bacterium]